MMMHRLANFKFTKIIFEINHEELEIADESRSNSMSRTRDCRTGTVLAPAGRSTALPPHQQYLH